MVRITRVHGFTEKMHQLKAISDPLVDYDCIMLDGFCRCTDIKECKYIKPDLEVKPKE